MDNCKENYNLIVDEELKGTRLDLVLSLNLEDTSRSYIQKLIEEGNVRVDGTIETSKKYKVKGGESLEIYIPKPEKLDILPEEIPLNIVYEDDDVMVINKPKGMVVHPAVGNHTGTLVNAIMYHAGEKLSSINGVVRPGIVHRIDKDTSGLIMVAKNDAAHESLSEQLKEHSITRRYIALVHNGFSEDSGTIDKPIGRDPSNRLRQAVTMKNSKNAVTHYKVLERLGAYTLVECRLETGRTHQIRVHMAYINHPLVGDPVYGLKKEKIEATGQMLHAKVLGFKHPRTGEYMEFSAELPDEFNNILDKIRKKV